MKSFVISAPIRRPSSRRAWILGAAVVLLGCADQADSAPAETQRDQSPLTAMEVEDSSLSFTMNKWMDAEGNTKVPVTGSFRALQVAASSHVHDAETVEELAGLSASVTIDLASVDTAMELRDQNITQSYFETSSFASAVFTLSNVRAQGSGDAGLVLADGELDLHGYTQRFADLSFRVRREEHGWRVESAAPIEVRSADFGLPVAALLAACGHAGIDDAASVEVALSIAEHTH